jgi:hypothetical protein
MVQTTSLPFVGPQRGQRKLVPYPSRKDGFTDRSKRESPRHKAVASTPKNPTLGSGEHETPRRKAVVSLLSSGEATVYCLVQPWSEGEGAKANER